MPNPTRIVKQSTLPSPNILPKTISIRLVGKEIIILIEDDSGLSTAYVGTESKFSDVRTDFYAFNAISLSVDRGVMRVSEDTGGFDPAGPVSGVDALIMLRALEKSFGE